MGFTLTEWFRALTLLFWLNFKHYCWAIWGLRLRLDPDYPAESRVRGDLIVDSVLEYRGYALFCLWCPFLALICPNFILAVFVGYWGMEAWKRADYYSSPFKFWTQAYNEAPGKMRNKVRYAEEISLEIERRMKAGDSWDSSELQKLINAGMDIQNAIVERKP